MKITALFQLNTKITTKNTLQETCLFYMFVRKKKNRSGSTSIVVIDKSHGKYKEVKTIGSSSNANEIALLYVGRRNL